MPSVEPTAPRDHLFISYASEDGALAEWLALRLTAENYKVWIDRFELLGGESYPKDIDRAIKNRTFRLLALLSKHSIDKDNPVKERTLALNLQRERGEELLIPLNVDGLSPAELDWMTSDITFVPFWDSWAAGLAQLLEKLERVDAPKGDQDGRAIAASVYLSDDVLSPEPEQVYANLLHFERIPKVARSFRLLGRLSPGERDALADEWAFWALPDRLGGGLYFSFAKPPDESPWGKRLSWVPGQAAEWRFAESLDGMRPEHVLKPLLRRSVLHHLRRKGLRAVSAKQPTVLYFPPDLLESDRLPFSMPGGSPRSRYRQVVGERAFPSGDRFRYHQTVTVDVLRGLQPDFIVKIRIGLHITDLNGEPLDAVSANARRKYMMRDWWNAEWLARHLAICCFMSNGEGKVVIEDEDPVILSASLIEFAAPRGINEEAVPKGTPRAVWASFDSETVEEEED